MIAEAFQSTASVFRRKLLAREHLLAGTFIKTPTPHATEILGSLGFDFVVVDAEHAPFDRRSTELVLLAARAAGIAPLVRIADASQANVLAALDDGAAGVLAPHIDSDEKARELAAWCRYSGRRGFSNSSRAGGYGSRGMWEHVDTSDREVSVIAMIEDVGGVEEIEKIVAVPGIDAVFIGRGDLSVALGDRQEGAPSVREATERVIQAACEVGKAVMIFESDAKKASEFRERGVQAFVAASDQSFMRTAAAQTLGEFQQRAGRSRRDFSEETKQ